MPMEIHKADITEGFNSCFNYATTRKTYFHQIAFLKTCKTLHVLPGGLKITNGPLLCLVTDNIKIYWYNTNKSVVPSF